jgi:acyl-coenzyme A thioesterase PaaI-like protein
VITSALDSASGAAVGSALAARVEGMAGWRPIATLDLRIDYMKPAMPGKDLLARAECYKLTRNVAFVRGTAYHDDPADPIATSVATFMLSAPDREPADISSSVAGTTRPGTTRSDTPRPPGDARG